MRDQEKRRLVLPHPLPPGIPPAVALAVAVDVVVARCGLRPVAMRVQADGEPPVPAGRGLPADDLSRAAELLLRDHRVPPRPGTETAGAAPAGFLVRIGPGRGVACEPPGGIVDAAAGWSTTFLLGRALAWLRAVVRDPAVPADVPSLLLRGERDQLLTTWNDTEHDWGPFEPIPAAVERAALARPDHTAIVFGPDRWSYAHLRRETGRYRSALAAAGIGPGDTVAVHLDRHPAVVAGLLAVLELRAAYLPVEPGLPEARVSTMLEDAGVGCVLTTHGGATRLPRSDAPVICVEDPPGSATGETGPRPAGAGPGDIAYVIFTSGSTGRPKGVRCTHAGLRNRLLWMQHVFQLDERDVVLHKTPLGFDVSLWELLWPLLAGARLVIAESGGHRDPAYLAALIRRAGVTVAHFVPSMLDVFLEEPAAARCRSLRLVVASGEELTRATVERFHRVLTAGLHNLYGPTEASIDVSHHACRPGDEGPVPIGRPIANTSLLVLDNHGALGPPGGEGELCIGGVGLAAGYTDPDLTASHFVPNIHPRGGERLYRTGDQVRQRRDGQLVFLGRIDDQVKVRGVRLELGEVEAALRAHPGVARAAAVVVADEGASRLEAFVVPSDGHQVDPQTLLDHCRLVLPASVRPSRVHLIEDLPLSANGKLDRTALAGLARLRPVPLAEEGPDGDTPGWPGAVGEAWASVTGRPPAPDVDLIASGGDSLTAIRILARLRARHGVSVRVADFLAEPTPRALVALAQRAGRDVPAVPAGDGPVRLTPEQSRIWLADHLGDGDSPYTLCCGVRLPRVPEEERLRHVLGELTARHPVLRSLVRLDDEGDLLMIQDHESAPDLLVLRPEAGAGPAVLGRFAGHPFEMTRRPPFRWCLLETGGQSWVYLAGHHVLIDGWSWHVLAGELLALLAENGLPRAAPPSFLDYARQVEQRPAPAARSACSRAGATAPASWAEHRGSQPAVLAERFVAEPARLGFEQNCRALGFTPHAGLLALLAVQLARRAGTRPPEVTVTATLSGRDEPGWEGTVGCFVRAEPVWLEIPERASLATLGPPAHAAVLAHLGRSPGAEDLRPAGRSVPGAVLTLQNTPLPPGLRPRDLTEVSCGRTKYGLRLDVATWDDGWSVAVERPRGASPGAPELADEYSALVAWAAADATADLLEATLPDADRPRPRPPRFVA